MSDFFNILVFWLADLSGATPGIVQAIGLMLGAAVLFYVLIPNKKPKPPPPPDPDQIDIRELEGKIKMKAAEVDRLRLDLQAKQRAYKAKKEAPKDEPG